MIKSYRWFFFITVTGALAGLLSFRIPAGDELTSRSVHVNLNWYWVHEDLTEGKWPGSLFFDGSVADPGSGLPVFNRTVVSGSHEQLSSANIRNPVYLPCTPAESTLIDETGYADTLIVPGISTHFRRKVPMDVVTFIPLRLNPRSGIYEKLISFTLDYKTGKRTKPHMPAQNHQYANHSVLASGNWIRIGITKSGIYRIGYDELISFGWDPSGIDPRNIRLYGNGGGMLPEPNNMPRPDDLTEVAIMVHGELDGVLNPEDYLLFYGESPHQWRYIPLGYYEFTRHLYSDTNCYFLTCSLGAGKRIQPIPQSNLTPTHEISTYDAWAVHAREDFNLIKSGKEWYGEYFRDQLVYDIYFDLPGLVMGSQATARMDFAGKSSESSRFYISIDDVLRDSATITPINPGSIIYARTKKKSVLFYPGPDDVKITLEYVPSGEASEGWLNYIVLNAERELKLWDGMTLFRYSGSIGVGNVTRFHVADTGPSACVWDVTNPAEPAEVIATVQNDHLAFNVATDSLREFMAFNGSSFLKAEFMGAVPNQNLHHTAPAEMVVVTHPLFMGQALQLADFHRQRDGMNVIVITPEQIYNEFSSGVQDVTAIRDFMRMLYVRYPGQEPRYLVLIGDGSYDPKDRLPQNQNFIPAFQNRESLDMAKSYVIDDYFGILDENEGNDCTGVLDVGIGRLTVRNAEEAQTAVDKIIRYAETGRSNSGNWRKNICIIADDEDGNLHLDQADSIARHLERHQRTYDIRKIYFDTYTQISTNSGYRYPDVNRDINREVEKGVMVMNYIGHGGERGWAAEKVLEIQDITGWDNEGKLPVFITATCEFTRFDNPAITSAGEHVFHNPLGGGIALFTTTRLAYASSNFSLNRLFYENLFDDTGGEMPRFGDLIMLSKPASSLTTRNFMLLGDPALRLYYPDYNIQTLTINGSEVSEGTQTLSGLQKVTLTGIIEDQAGQPAHDFCGMLHIKVFDKASEYITHANDMGSLVTEFDALDRVLHQGKATVTNGHFECSFIIPRGLLPGIDTGKVSYYADDSLYMTSAGGFFDGFIVGGTLTDPEADLSGPDITLYLNDKQFQSGDQVHPDPLLMAYLWDDHGIQWQGLEIGRDITAVLDKDAGNKWVLNEYFDPDLDSYQGGWIVFPMTGIADGWHELTLKAYDLYGNPSEVTVSFLIDTGAEITLSGVRNYPNPFSSSTRFSFRHNRPGDQLKVNLHIFNLAGREVASFTNSVIAGNIETEFLEWDGTGMNGARLGNGSYIYRLRVTDFNGLVSERTQKLIICR
ncbi:MAG: type IX secretion system sortase PorU [Bacteroidales bacterium]|nr:type IX secretion system sortase PorU [Bacteroidales bacterium]